MMMQATKSSQFPHIYNFFTFLGLILWIWMVYFHLSLLYIKYFYIILYHILYNLRKFVTKISINFIYLNFCCGLKKIWKHSSVKIFNILNFKIYICIVRTIFYLYHLWTYYKFKTLFAHFSFNYNLNLNV